MAAQMFPVDGQQNRNILATVQEKTDDGFR